MYLQIRATEKAFQQSLFPCGIQCGTEYIYKFTYKENKQGKMNMNFYVQKGLPVFLDIQEIRDRSR